MSSLNKELHEDIVKRADALTDVHMENPTQADYVLIRLAMTVGATLAFEYINKSERSSMGMKDINDKNA